MSETEITPGAPDTWADQMLREFAEELMRPRERECLQCYVARMLDDFGCNTRLRFATHFRDLTAPAALALPRRLGRVGAFCDCEIFLNGWWLDRAFWLTGTEPAAQSREAGATSAPAPLPPCTGVRRGSTQPCDIWVRRRQESW